MVSGWSSLSTLLLCCQPHLALALHSAHAHTSRPPACTPPHILTRTRPHIPHQGGESAFIASMCRCRRWESRGGKSNAYFAKTRDDRYIVKSLSKVGQRKGGQRVGFVFIILVFSVGSQEGRSRQLLAWSGWGTAGLHAACHGAAGDIGCRRLLSPNHRRIVSTSRLLRCPAPRHPDTPTFPALPDPLVIPLQSEKASFMSFAPHYFAYMGKRMLDTAAPNPTCLAKVLGVFSVTFKPQPNTAGLDGLGGGGPGGAAGGPGGPGGAGGASAALIKELKDRVRAGRLGLDPFRRVGVLYLGRVGTCLAGELASLPASAVTRSVADPPVPSNCALSPSPAPSTPAPLPLLPLP